MHRPAVDIYSGPLVALTDSLLRDVARVFNTAGRAYIYIANGHGAWEAALTNVLARRQGAGAGERPLRDRLGRGRPPHGRRGRGAAGRHAPRGAAGRRSRRG